MDVIMEKAAGTGVHLSGIYALRQNRKWRRFRINTKYNPKKSTTSLMQLL